MRKGFLVALFLALAFLLLSALSFGEDTTIDGDLTVTGDIFSVVTFRDYSLSTKGTGTFFMGGYYNAPIADANLDEGGATQTLGLASVSYAAHAFLVAAAAGTATGGSGAVIITVGGTSITDGGTRTETDTETLVADITTMSTDQYFETVLKWVGQVTFTLDDGATGHTAFAADFNYGFSKYDDFANRNHTITDFVCDGNAGANDTGFNIELLTHKATGWTYSAAAFDPGPAATLDMNAIHGVEQNLANGIPFSFKRDQLSTTVDGNDGEGCIIRVTTGATNAIESMDCHIGATIEP